MVLMSNSLSIDRILLSVLLIALTACSKPAKHSTQNAAVPMTFASPSEAGAALFTTAKSGDRTALIAIFGHDGEVILSTGDAAKDANNLRAFADAYARVNRWDRIKAGGQ